MEALVGRAIVSFSFYDWAWQVNPTSMDAIICWRSQEYLQDAPLDVRVCTFYIRSFTLGSKEPVAGPLTKNLPSFSWESTSNPTLSWEQLTRPVYCLRSRPTVESVLLDMCPPLYHQAVLGSGPVWPDGCVSLGMKSSGDFLWGMG